MAGLQHRPTQFKTQNMRDKKARGKLSIKARLTAQCTEGLTIVPHVDLPPRYNLFERLKYFVVKRNGTMAKDA